jgi:hypothetical protein
MNDERTPRQKLQFARQWLRNAEANLEKVTTETADTELREWRERRDRDLAAWIARGLPEKDFFIFYE